MSTADEDFIGPEVLERLRAEDEATEDGAAKVALYMARFGRRWREVMDLVQEGRR